MLYVTELAMYVQAIKLLNVKDIIWFVSQMEVAQSELDVFLKNQNYDQGKLEETRAKLEEVAKVAIEKEKYEFESFLNVFG